MASPSDDFNVFEFNEFIRVLMADVDFAGDLALMTGSPVARRAFARAVFAFVEGNVYFLRATALAVCGELLSPAERFVLEEKTYQLNDKADVVARPSFTPFEGNLKFVHKIVSRHLAPGAKLDLGGKGWQAFKRSLEVRHRVTHPKKLADLDITDAELDDLRETMHWTCVQLGALWNEALRNHPEYRPPAEAGEASLHTSGDEKAGDEKADLAAPPLPQADD